jgi:hypothetical protein
MCVELSVLASYYLTHNSLTGKVVYAADLFFCVMFKKVSEVFSVWKEAVTLLHPTPSYSFLTRLALG